MTPVTASDVLDLEDLLTEARRTAGLDDFGDDGFREGLAVLLETYRINGYAPEALGRVRGRLVGLLTERLRIEDA